MVGVSGSLDKFYYKFNDGTYLSVDYDYEIYSEKYKPDAEITWWITLNKDTTANTKTIKTYFYKTYNYSEYGDDVPDEVIEKYESVKKKLIAEKRHGIKKKIKKLK